MTLDQKLGVAVEEMHDFGSSLAVPSIEGHQTGARVQQPRWAYAAAAALIVLAAIGLFAVFAPMNTDDPGVVDEPVPTPAVPSTRVSTATETTVAAVAPPDSVADTPAPVSITWTRLDDPSVFGETDTGIGSLAVTEYGLFAGGIDGPDAVIWRSSDGLTWQRAEDPDGVFGAAHSPFGTDSARNISDFASSGGRTIAVGSDTNVPRAEIGATASQLTAAAVWYTDDGLDWHRVKHDPDVFGSEGWNDLYSVTAGDDGFLAVGSGGVVRSPDGIVWERSSNPPDLELLDVIAVDDGFIAAGVTSMGVAVPAIWYSTDGIDWQQADVEGTDSPGTAWCQLSSVVETDDGFAAVGCLSKASQDGAAWWSADGVTWELVHAPPAGRLEQLYAIASDGRILVAGGAKTARAVIDEQAIVSTTGLIWISIDGGQTWEVQPDDPALGSLYSEGLSGYVAGITMFNDRIIAAGFYAGHAAIWIGEWDE